MVKIINSSNETLAILENVTSPIITEEINREFTFTFSTVIDNDKSSYVNYQNKAEADGNYFNIVYTGEERTQDGVFIRAECEHVSYDLIDVTFTAGFTATGLFSAVATTLLSGTAFTVGTVEITASQTISVKEATNARQLLMQLASLYSGELEFGKYQISLLTRRGADRGVQFRYRKNLVGVKRITDNRKKVGGLPTISYQVSAAELEFEQGYIDAGVSSLEHYELGDTVKVIDEGLNLEVSLRIVKESHDVNQRMQGTVEISNFVDDLADTLTTIQTTSVSKDNVYNGCSIGPENGFVAERSDALVKTTMNATNGIEIDLRNTTTASYTAVFYVQVDTATGTVKLYLAGNAVFTGQVIASDFIGGTISIGSGSNTFNANGTDGIWFGHSAFSTAPFSVSLSGSATAYDLTLRGGLFNIGTGTNTLQFNTTDGLYLGATAFATAPFRVTMSGSVTAEDLTTGNSVYIGNNDSINKALRLRTILSSDATIAAWWDMGPGIALGYLNASDPTSATMTNLSNIFLLANLVTLYGDLDVDDHNILNVTKVNWVSVGTIEPTDPAGSTGDMIWGTGSEGTGPHIWKSGQWYALQSVAVT